MVKISKFYQWMTLKKLGFFVLPFGVHKQQTTTIKLTFGVGMLGVLLLSDGDVFDNQTG